MANQSDDSGIVKLGLLIDFKDDSQKETHMAKHSIQFPPIKYNMLEKTPCSPDGTQELMASISELKTMVLGVEKQNKSVGQQFQQLAARLDMVDSRISAIESLPSRHLLKETSEINKETTYFHLRDPTVGSETSAEYLQTSVTA